MAGFCILRPSNQLETSPCNRQDRSAARAAAYLAKVNLEIVKAAATRRQGRLGPSAGARPPASIAAAPVALAEITAPQGATRAPSTPPGYRTARRAPQMILARLPATDPRLEAARRLADAVERVGAVKGADWQGSDSNGGLSDGGATTRVKHAERLRRIEALANGWEIDRDGHIRKGRPRILLARLQIAAQRRGRIIRRGGVG